MLSLTIEYDDLDFNLFLSVDHMSTVSANDTRCRVCTIGSPWFRKNSISQREMVRIYYLLSLPMWW